MTAFANGRFDDVIASEDELRAIVGEPNRWITSKVKRRLDENCIRFIARSPFLVVASASAAGQLDVSPKGDPAGFVRVLDATTLALPETVTLHGCATWIAGSSPIRANFPVGKSAWW